MDVKIIVTIFQEKNYNNKKISHIKILKKLI